MKREKDLYSQIFSFENLYVAYLKARQCKRYREDVIRFAQNLENEIFQIQEDLTNKTYHTGKYYEFYISDPKRRLISALPFGDRVVQHALVNIIEPVFDKIFIFDSYACRKNKGVHAGIKRLREYLKSISHSSYCLKCDIYQYFHSINHDKLKDLIRRKIKCKDTLWLIDDIIDSKEGDVGIPIGNLTSQLFANIYLNPMDHFIKEILGCKYYMRYMDDWIVLHEEKSFLWGILNETQCFLDDFHVKTNNKTSIFPVTDGIDFLGYRNWHNYRKLRKRNVQKNKRKFKKMKLLLRENKITQQKINQSLASFLGYIKWANSYRTRKQIFKIIYED